MNKLLPYLETFLDKSPVFLAFFLPLFFLPITTEFFETAKIAFLIIYGCLLFLAWSLRMVVEKKVTILRSPLDKAFAVMVVAMALSTLFSANPYLGLLGSYLRFQPSLVFSFILLVYFYVLGANLKEESVRRSVVIYFVAAMAISSTLSVIAFLGLSQLIPGLPVFLQSRSFNTFGSTTALSLLSALAVTLDLGLIADSDGKSSRSKNANLWLKLALYPLLTIILAYNQLVGYLALVLGLSLFFGFTNANRFKLGRSLLPLAIWALIVMAALTTPQITGNLKLNIQRPQEVVLDPTTSWQVTTRAVTDRPLFGVGLGRFSQIFTLYKPLTFNASNFWNLRFDRPFNEIFLLLSEAGVIGLAAFLWFLWNGVYLVIKSHGTAEPLYCAIKASILTLITSYFLITSSSQQNFLLVLLLVVLISKEETTASTLVEKVVLTLAAIKDKLFKSGDAVGISRETLGSNGKKGYTQVLPYVLLGAAVLSSLLLIPTTALAYLGEFYSRQTLQAVSRNDGRAAYNNLSSGLGLNPYLDVYQRNMAQLALGIAANISSRPQVSDTDRQAIQGLIAESVRRARIASEVLEPNSVVNWETRAQIYQNLINVAQNAEAWTIDAYSKAIILDPTNPNLRLLLGGIYYGLGNYDLAAQAFSQAVSLKSDLANTHYNLAQALIKLDRQTDALTQYDITLSLVPKGSPDFQQAQKEREALASSIQAAKKAAEEAQNNVNRELNVNTPTTRLQKRNVVPPEINLGNPGKEATPSAQ